MKNRRIFVASTMSGTHVARTLSRILEEKFNTIQWTDGAFNVGIPLVQSLQTIADEIDLAVFVMPPDDYTTKYNDESKLKSNLLFEIGLFVGVLGLDRVLIVMSNDPFESFSLPTHLQGLAISLYDKSKNTDLAASLVPVTCHIIQSLSKFTESKNRNEYYSCFLSYSSFDKIFVTKLYADLVDVGIRCWLDEKDLKIGDSISGQISRAIEAHDKVLLVLSEASLNSAWVNKEIQNVLHLEALQKRAFLFPVRIDDSILSSPKGGPLLNICSRYIGDFRNWQDSDNYRKSFSRLIRDLAICTSIESGGNTNA